jgi:hypothetical protein
MSASTAARSIPSTTFTFSNHSYLTHKSAPNTPGILSHHVSSSSKPRHRHHPETDLSRAQSSAHLPSPARPHRSEANIARTRRLHKSALQLHADDGEWLFRAGATIANDVEDSKGQGWLSQRASSTSLVGLDVEDGTIEAVTPWEVRRRRLELDARSRSRAGSARGSRVPSRVQSARASRSNSGVRVEGLGVARGLGMTSGQGLQVEEEDYFGGKVEDVRDDDVDELEDSVEALYNVEDEGMEAEEDEDELARLTEERSFGLGPFVDRFMAWTIFSPSNENEDRDRHSEQDKDASLDMSRDTTSVPADPQESTSATEGAGWKDMVWLFGVAVSVLL